MYDVAIYQNVHGATQPALCPKAPQMLRDPLAFLHSMSLESFKVMQMLFSSFIVIPPPVWLFLEVRNKGAAAKGGMSGGNAHMEGLSSLPSILSNWSPLCLHCHCPGTCIPSPSTKHILLSRRHRSWWAVGWAGRQACGAQGPFFSFLTDGRHHQLILALSSLHWTQINREAILAYVENCMD